MRNPNLSPLWRIIRFLLISNSEDVMTNFFLDYSNFVYTYRRVVDTNNIRTWISHIGVRFSVVERTQLIWAWFARSFLLFFSFLPFGSLCRGLSCRALAALLSRHNCPIVLLFWRLWELHWLINKFIWVFALPSSQCAIWLPLQLLNDRELCSASESPLSILAFTSLGFALFSFACFVVN